MDINTCKGIIVVNFDVLLSMIINRTSFEGGAGWRKRGGGEGDEGGGRGVIGEHRV